jgi:glycosyltransferase involved in cell wall biosynthesis
VLNILVLVNGLYTKKVTTGGEYHVLRVVNNWNKGHRVFFIMPRIGYRSAVEIADVHSFYFSSHEKVEPKGYTKLFALYLVRIRRSLSFKPKENPNVIIASSHLLYDILPAVILRRRLKSELGVYVFHLLRSFKIYRHGIWSNISLLNEKIGLFLCKRAADLIFVDNRNIKNDLVDMGLRENKIFITENAPEHELIDSINDNGKSIDGCFCGRLFRNKGIYDLPEVWERVLKYYPLSSLVIIGQGPEYNKLLDIIEKKGLEKNITLTGYLSDKEKISRMKSSRIFITPSYEEGWGIAASEAMTCGLPVVCYDLPAYEVFSGGMIKVEVGNRLAMADAVVDLLGDEKKQADLADEAREATKVLNWEKIATDELNMITSVLTFRP